MLRSSVGWDSVPTHAPGTSTSDANGRDRVPTYEVDLTQESVLGTPPYMAPEQFRGQPGNAGSDVWALGVTLYEMAAGTRPFHGGTTYDLSASILTQSPSPLPAKVPAPQLTGLLSHSSGW